MNTFELARTLNAVRTINVATSTSEVKTQPFDYLLVLDFEATCWDKTDLNRQPPEVIEFAVVLYDVGANVVLEEFQQYVMPTEVPRLSEFCTDFTGISQAQVDGGVPIGTCLMLFNRWLNALSDKYTVVFDTRCDGRKLAVFATWSDWDLKICLHNECRRKHISKAYYFNSWIDLKAMYKAHYCRIPKGLNGALTEVGLGFIGKEHCGLHDARNTALLTGRMISDGVYLQLSPNNFL